MRFLALTVVLALIAVGCSTPEPTAEPTQMVPPTAAEAVAVTPVPETAEAEASGGLIGTLWLWQGTQKNDDTSYTPVDPSSYSVMFSEDGALSVVADCNLATGTYEVDDTNLTITLGPVTLAECGPESLSQEYLFELGEVNSYVTEGDDLYLVLKLDTGSMQFSPAP